MATLNTAQPLAGRLLIGYYAATAVFMLLDYAAGFNMRLTFLDDQPGWRFAWYVVCLGCFLLMLYRPQWTAWIAATESLLTLSMIILSTALKVTIVTDEMIEQGRGDVSMLELANFVVSSTVVYISYQRSLREIRQQNQP